MKSALLLSMIFASATISTSSEVKLSLSDDDRVAEPLVSEATEEARLAIQGIGIPEGLEISQWATEPMLANPVAMEFDEQGRLFVAETYRYRSSVLDIRHYMEMLEGDLASRTVDDRETLSRNVFGEAAKTMEVESELVRLIEDRDGDGEADFSSIYADGFDDILDGIASGVLPRKGEVYFTNIPHLWKLEGMDENGQSTKRTSMHRGFGVHFGFTGHDLHGLAIGPDGKLYFSIGDRGTNIISKEGTHIDFPDMGGVFRCDLDGSNLEPVHTGLRNPQELVFDEYGNLFTGDNDCDKGDEERFVHIVEGGDSGWRIGWQFNHQGNDMPWLEEKMWNLRNDKQPAYIIPPVCYLEDGPSGLTYYPGTGLSEKYRGHFFLAHFKGAPTNSGIRTYTLKPKGATFDVTSSEPFVTGALPTDVTFAPDGRLYICDWVNGYPKSRRGRVYSIFDPQTDESELVQSTKKLIGEGMEGRSLDELAELLAHPNWKVRLEAQFELADRGPKSLDTLKEIAFEKKGELFGRLHATWGLGQLAAKGNTVAKEAITALGSAKENEVRAQAAKLIGDHGIDAGYDALIKGLKDKYDRVRFFSAQSLGKLGNPEAAPALIALLRSNKDKDNYIRHAAVMGLSGAPNHSALKKAAEDSSSAVRMGALLAFRRLEDPYIARFLKDSDERLVLEAARAINDMPIDAARGELAKMVDSPLAKNPVLGLRAVNAVYREGGAENAAVLAQVVMNNDVPDRMRVMALTHLKNWAEPEPRDWIVGTYRPLPERDESISRAQILSIVDPILENGSQTVQIIVIDTLVKMGVTDSADKLYAFVGDVSKNAESRVAALRALDTFEDPRTKDLTAMTGSSSESALRVATLPIVARYSPEEAGPVLERMLAEGDAAEQRNAFSALATMKHPIANRLIVESLERLAKGEVPDGAQLELLELAENSVNSDVEKALKAYNDASEHAEDPLLKYRFALEGGVEWKGRGVFRDNKAMACLRCHVVDDSGGEAGPNLSNIGAIRTREEMLESIVYPSKEMAPGFETTIATMKDTSVKVGVVLEESDKLLRIKLADGTEESIQKSKIAKRDTPPSSMPPVFHTTLSREQLRNLIEYMATLDTDPVKASISRAMRGDS